MRRRMSSGIGVSAAAAIMLAASGAAAHPYIVGNPMMPGQIFDGTLTLTHSCFGKPTVEVTLRFPHGATEIEGQDAKGWTAAADPAKNQVTWHGGPEAGRVTLPVHFRVPALPMGKAVFFPIVQRCTGGEVHRWVDIPAAGQTHDDLSYPAAEAVIGAKLEVDEDEPAHAPGGH